MRGETYSKHVYFKDKNGDPLDPDTTDVTVYDPTGNSAGSVSLLKVEPGKYELNYNIGDDADLGDWRVLIEAAKGEWKRKHLLVFTVREL